MIRDSLIGGPKCTGLAETAHHKLPSSTHPHLFFALENLEGACKPCNYGDGAVVRANNRNVRQLVAHLEGVAEHQQAQIAVLAAQLARYQNREPEPSPRSPGRPQTR